MTSRISYCIFCKHYYVTTLHCAAYPEPNIIPLDFLCGEEWHLEYTGDDNGIKFEFSDDEIKRAILIEEYGDVLKEHGYDID